MIRFSCYFIILDLVFILSCLNKTEKINFVNKNEPEKFENFLNRFNTDENFRNSRIITPLPGYNSDDFEDDYENESEVLEDYYWNDQEIKMYLKEKYNSKNYNFEILNKTDSIIEERIFIDGSGFEVKRIFKLRSNIWYLGYYFYRT